eukprot:CAMPEP_0195323344 /NCGR_PEP_ID=MMETSP0708-20121125/7866_1 /TAXON_ID=33640 /ORGANISM="Asterionellopsis glacialis, Strain CCMP134" /LENGTH=51 /DNA_ID=CAMNT_0040390373 /DNA_START=138 /DNA_END=293 /DNA_ORIENTATION=-
MTSKDTIVTPTKVLGPADNMSPLLAGVGEAEGEAEGENDGAVSVPVGSTTS